MLRMFSEGLKFVDKLVKRWLKPHAGGVLKVAARAKCLQDVFLCLYLYVVATFKSTAAHALLEACNLLYGFFKELLLLSHLTCLSAIYLRKEITGICVQ